MSYRLICFDAGFTLIRPRRTMQEQLREVLVAHGHEAGDDDLRRAWEVADAWFWEEYHAPGNATWTSDAEIERTWRSYHRLMIRELGFEDLEHDLVDAVLASQFAVEAWEPYEETLDVLGAIRQGRDANDGAAPSVAIVSDWASTLREVVDAVGLTPYVDDVLSSGAEGLAKPDPAFFRLACRRAGVDPSQAVMIGDSLRADVLGAQSAGMAAVLLDRTGTSTDVPPGTPVAPSLREAVQLASVAVGAG